MKQTKIIYLASQSARRHELIQKLKIPFKIVDSSYEEVTPPGEKPDRLVLRHSLGKASGAMIPKRRKKGCREIILGSDTVVYYAGKVLGKPRDMSEAKEQLLSLSGHVHSVYSGICLQDAATGQIVLGWDRTRVRFKKWRKSQIEEYLKIVQPLDKAGSYAIQIKPSIAASYEGSRSNVVGLPLELLRRMLREIR